MQRHRHLINEITALVERICQIAGDANMIESIRADLAETGVVDAVRTRDDDALFSWLKSAFSFQGIGDRAAATYMGEHNCPSRGRT